MVVYTMTKRNYEITPQTKLQIQLIVNEVVK